MSATVRVRRMGRKAATPPPPGSPGEVLRVLIQARAPERSHAAIARDAGITPAKLSDILTGKTESPGILTVGRILAAVNATFCDYHKAAKKIAESGIRGD